MESIDDFLSNAPRHRHELGNVNLIAEEHVVWTGKPLLKALKKRNIQWVSIDLIKQTLAVLGFFSIYYAAFQKQFFPIEDIYSVSLFLVVIISINIVRLVNKIANAEKICYYITNKRIIIISGTKNNEPKYLDKSEVIKKTFVKSRADSIHNVATIKLLSMSDDTYYLESIPDGNTVFELIK